MMLFDGGKDHAFRRIGIYQPECSKLTIALWLLYITFDWIQSPYREKSRCLNIFVVGEIP